MATLSDSPAELIHVIPPHRFTTALYLEMIEKRLLTPDDPVELVGGLIVEKSHADLPLYRFSTARYLEMIEKGIIGPHDRVELVEGVIVDMSPAGSRHNQFLGQLIRLFAPLLDSADVWSQGTLVVADGQVYDPDIMLLRRKPGGYKLKLPGPEDVLLLVEAAESSFRLDQQIKLPVYAAAGIPEYWIADLAREEIIVHREPDGNAYRVVQTFRGEDVVSPLAAPELSFAVQRAFN